MDEERRACPADGLEDHVRQASRLRVLARNQTTAELKTRLLEEAEEHERFVMALAALP